MASADLTLDLVIDGSAKIYHVAQFNTTFSQPNDHKGQPQSEIEGGIISFVLSEVPDNILNGWMIKNYEKKGGVFTFHKGVQTSPLTITFKEAYCVDYQQSVMVNTGISTRLVISAKNIKLNGKEHENRWK